jgi:subtilisin family serine protease
VNVYIIDTGIRSTHVDFEGRVVGAYDGVGDGYGPEGCHTHGTHVAGIAGGKFYGVAKKVTLHSVRVLNCTGGATWEQIIAGIDWVAQNRSSPLW